MRTLAAAAAAALAPFLALAGCAGAPAPTDTVSPEEAFIRDIRAGAPDNTETDLELLDAGTRVCDGLADETSLADRAHLVAVWRGDRGEPGYDFVGLLLRASTEHLCPDLHEDYLRAADLADDGGFDG